MAHVTECGHKFVIRVKDIDSKGVLSDMGLPDTYFDKSILETLSYNEENSNLLVHTKISPNIYRQSMIQIESVNGIYDIICKKYPEIQSGTEQDWASEEQWKRLYHKLNKSGSLANIINKEFGSTTNLSMVIKTAFKDTDSEKAWLLWIAMKIFGTKENAYLSLAVKKSISVKNLIELSRAAEPADVNMFSDDECAVRRGGNVQ